MSASCRCEIAITTPRGGDSLIFFGTTRTDFTRPISCLLLAAIGAAPLACDRAAAQKKEVYERDWTHVVEMPVPPRRGEEQPPKPACLWLPKGVDKVRGLLYPGGVMIDKRLGTDRAVREALAREKMGVLFFHLGSNFIQGGGRYLEDALAALAKASGHPEIEFAPLLTAGHSTAGLFCRNVAYWKPHRVIAPDTCSTGWHGPVLCLTIPRSVP